jgi:hypothetical protein
MVAMPRATLSAEPPGAAPAATGAAPSADLNFDLMDAPSPPPDPMAQQKAQLAAQQGRTRRRALVAHQAIGFVALAALTATVIIGHLNYNDLYVSGDYSGRYQTAHLGLSVSTTALFTTTGLLGVLAPNPYPKPLRFDTALVHKVAMILATAGMATQIVLGAVTARQVGHQDQANLALGHVVVGYATWAFMATGVVAYFF